MYDHSVRGQSPAGMDDGGACNVYERVVNAMKLYMYDEIVVIPVSCLVCGRRRTGFSAA